MPKISGLVYDHTNQPAGDREVRLYRRDTGALIGRTRTFDGTNGDPHWDKTVLITNCDGAGGDTSLIDQSPLQQVITATNNGMGLGGVLDSNRRLSNRVASMAFRNTQYDRFAAPHNALMNLGTRDFTIEVIAAFYTLTASVGHGIITKGWPMVGSGYGEWLIYKDGSNNIAFYGSANSSSWDIASGVVVQPAANIALNTPQHYAVTRQGSSFRTFGGGVLRNSFSSTASFASNTQPVFFGGTPYTSSNTTMQGWIYAARITMDVCRYTTSFTPPTYFPNVLSPQIGYYEFNTPFTGEVDVVCLDDDGGTVYPDLIQRAVPA